MKISDTSDTVVERNGIADEGAFGIIFNAKMATVLSDGLYSDKIQSIIREISCNAVDSHVEAGYPSRPIEVHLPNSLEPWFHVRDFGIGLNHKQVQTIYTMYGASTKTTSNDFTGCLGLGSKSPFSYTDAFDVVARKDGVERHYSMFRNEKGMPSSALLLEQPTNEENGVTVKVPVKNEDTRRFVEKAGMVYQWFDTKPMITGASNYQVYQHTVLYGDKHWELRKKNNDYYNQISNRPMAIMGRVAYPINPNSITNLNSNQRTVLELPITLKFDIGDLEVAASREQLGYDDRTQANIRRAVDVVIAQMRTVFEAEIANIDTEWNARKKFGEILGHDSGMRWELERIYGQLGLKWKGKTIKDMHINAKIKDMYGPTGHEIYTLESHRKKSLKFNNYYEDITIRCSEKIKIIFDDLPSGGLARAQHWYESSGGDAFIFGPSSIKTRDQILDILGNPPYLLTSNMDKRPPVKRGPKVKGYAYRGEGGGQKAWTATDIQIEDGGVYVVLDRWDVVDGNTPRDDLEYVRKEAIDSGLFDENTVIIAARGTLRDKIKEDPNWTEFFTSIRDAVAGKMGETVLQTVADCREHDRAYNEISDTSLWNHYYWNKIDMNGAYGLFVSNMKVLHESATIARKTGNNVATLMNLSNRVGGVQINLPEPSIDMKPLYQTVKSQYPMIFAMGHRYGTGITKENIGVITDYINMVDQTTKKKDGENIVAGMLEGIV
jgi:hypothetical protein